MLWRKPRGSGIPRRASWPTTSAGSSTSSRSGRGGPPRRSGSGGGVGEKTSLAVAVGLAIVGIVAAIVLSASLAAYQHQSAPGSARRCGRSDRASGRSTSSRPTWRMRTVSGSASRGRGQGMLWLVSGLKAADRAATPPSSEHAAG